MPELSSGYDRLDDEIAWYDARSGSAQKLFKGTKLAEVVSAAAIPVAAQSYPLAAAILGGVVLVLETLQHVNQWQHNWITYRATCEALRHEKYAYLGRVGHYDGSDDVAAKKRLVDRVESLISTEHSKWMATQEQLRDKDAKAAEAA